MKTLLPLLLASLALVNVSCSTQYMQTADGRKIVNNNLLSAGTLHISADGSILMSGTAEKAAEELGKYGKLVRDSMLYKAGIDAVGNVAQDAVKEISN